jgi:hypothetical protein
MEIDFNESSLMWRQDQHLNSMGRWKKSKPLPWHVSRCGTLLPSGKYCDKKSYFSGMSRHQKHDIDMCDRSINCYKHRGKQSLDFAARTLHMEHVIIDRVSTQKELNINEENRIYLQSLRDKYGMSTFLV